jgi:hypothetical protein
MGAVAFLARAYKLQVKAVGQAELRGAKGFEEIYFRTWFEFTGCSFGQLHAIADTYKVRIFCGPAQDLVAHKTTYEKARNAQLLRSSSNTFYSLQFYVSAIDIHIGRCKCSGNGSFS